MSNKDIYILGIESSCDDTSAAILKNDKVLSNVIANQDIHKNYGGVVPELASRAHLSNIIPTDLEFGVGNNTAVTPHTSVGITQSLL